MCFPNFPRLWHFYFESCLFIPLWFEAFSAFCFFVTIRLPLSETKLRTRVRWEAIFEWWIATIPPPMIDRVEMTIGGGRPELFSKARFGSRARVVRESERLRVDQFLCYSSSLRAQKLPQRFVLDPIGARSERRSVGREARPNHWAIYSIYYLFTN